MSFTATELAAIRRQLDAIRKNSEIYLPTLSVNIGRPSLEAAARASLLQKLRVIRQQCEVAEDLVLPPLDEQWLPNVQTGPWPSSGSFSLDAEQATASGITYRWCNPDKVLRPGVVVTIPGGPDAGYAAFPPQEITRHLGVRVLSWDTRDRDPNQAVLDILEGIALARSKATGRVVLAAHSFGGLATGAVAIGSRASTLGPDAYVPVSAVPHLGSVSGETVGEPFRTQYLAANVNPMTFKRRIPVIIVTGSNDIPSVMPSKVRQLAQTYHEWGGQVKLRVVIGGNHSDTWTSSVYLDSIREALG